MGANPAGAGTPGVFSRHFLALVTPGKKLVLVEVLEKSTQCGCEVCNTSGFVLDQGVAFGEASEAAHMLYNISLPCALAPESGTSCDSHEEDSAHREPDKSQ